MEIIKIKIDDLKPYKNNAKLHPDWQIEQIIKSIEQFGFNDPIAIWGEDVDAGCTNRKLGSDQPLSQPNGLHGKDLSKADVSISIYLALKSKELGIPLEAKVSIGDDKVIIENKEILYKDIADYVKEYINSLGGFEKFAEWGIQY